MLEHTAASTQTQPRHARDTTTRPRRARDVSEQVPLRGFSLALDEAPRLPAALSAASPRSPAADAGATAGAVAPPLLLLGLISGSRERRRS